MDQHVDPHTRWFHKKNHIPHPIRFPPTATMCTVFYLFSPKEGNVLRRGGEKKNESSSPLGLWD